MTKFELSNGQEVELTKDGILIKGNDIKIEGMISIRKDDKYISVVEQDGNKIKQFSVNIDDEPVKTKINIDNSIVKQALESLSIELHGKTAVIDSELTKIIADIEKLKEKPEHKHVRIEFDHINDVPEIFIDGKKVTDGLVSLNVDWKTNTESISEKSFEVKLINKDGYETAIGEKSLG